MKKLLLALVGATAFCAPAHAQLNYDMAKVTCAEYLAMDPDTSRDFSAWMSGWFNQKGGSTTINVDGFRKNVANVKSWCQKSPKSGLMGGLQAAMSTAKPGVGGPASIDASQISCGEFLNADPDTQALVGGWVGGWFMSTKNLTNIQSDYVSRNAKVIGKYCESHKKDSLMDATAKNWK